MVAHIFRVSNDVLIAISLSCSWLLSSAPSDREAFKSLHLAMGRVPGSLSVATIGVRDIRDRTGMSARL